MWQVILSLPAGHGWHLPKLLDTRYYRYRGKAIIAKQFLSAGSCHTTPLPQTHWNYHCKLLPGNDPVRQRGGESLPTSPFCFLGRDLFSQISRSQSSYTDTCNHGTESRAEKDTLYTDIAAEAIHLILFMLAGLRLLDKSAGGSCAFKRCSNTTHILNAEERYHPKRWNKTEHNSYLFFHTHRCFF